MTKNLSEITKDYLETLFAFNPVYATTNGYPGFDDKYPNYSADSVQDIIQKCQQTIQDVTDLQIDHESIDADLLKRHAELHIHDLMSKQDHILNPSAYVILASDSFFSLIMSSHRSNEEKVHFITSRLQALPDFLKHAQKIISTPVKLWTDIAIKEIPGLSTYFNEVITPFFKTNKVVSGEKLIKEARHAIFDFSNFLSGLTDVKEDFAIGRDNFEYLLKTFHGIDKSAKEIKDIGFSQIDSLNKQLNEQAEKIDDLKTWQELVDLLKENHPTEEGLIKAYQNKVSEIKEFLIQNKIVTLPKDESLKIISTPEFLQNSIPYAAYCPPTMFAPDSQGLFFVSPAKGNQEVLKEHCYAAFPLTALHEAYPGHHLQFAIQRTLNSDIRKIYDVASYYEGWTLYCEEMMYRCGFYDDAMRLYQLKDRLWRAARIVVDVSMQCYGMTDDEAVTFLVDNAKLSPQGARVDVNWYTQSPTIPMSYLIGTLEVDRMREQYINQGKSLMEFHDAFLSCGAIPLKHVREVLFSKN